MLRKTLFLANSPEHLGSGQGQQQPWYAPAKKVKKVGKIPSLTRNGEGSLAVKKIEILAQLFNASLCLCFAILCGYFIARIQLLAPSGITLFLYAVLIGFSLFLAVFFAIRQVGCILQQVKSSLQAEPPAALALQFFKGELNFEEGRHTVPAPELALQQFVLQVRAYATEKMYQKNRQENPKLQQTNPLLQEPVDLLRRRWNEVMDSLNEFEIYLANDPRGMMTKLVSKFPAQNIDISQVFRDVSDAFDNTWRKKGINIESAIVTPLRATTNEALLRRMLVGPWRACAYFAKRGGGVLFSAKSQDRNSGGAVLARWECEGLMIPDEYLKIAVDMERSVNERIEIGLEKIAPDPASPNTLHALISFITWIDLVQTVGAEYHLKHTNDGFVIELLLR